jgi:two-component sensor histidine kinase/putative methionine-R-sulfoxide reductase with GAF domain
LSPKANGQNESGELLRQQAVFARFGEFSLRSENLDEILTEACRLVREALGADLAKVVELEADGQTLLVRAGVGWKPGVVGKVRIQLDEGSSEGHAISTGEPVMSANIDEETRFHYAGFLRDNGVKAIVNVLIIGGRDKPPFGILQVDSHTPRRFTETDIAFLSAYANLLASAVERLRAIGIMRDHNRELERRVAERTRELTASNRELASANRRLETEAIERARIQEALHEAHKMETVVEHLPIGAALISPSGKMIVGNPEFHRLLPRAVVPSADPEAGETWIGYDRDGRRIEPHNYPAARALRGEPTLNLDFLHRGGTEGNCWRRVSGIPVYGKGEQPVAALVVIVDVDDEKRAVERQTLLTREVDHRAKNMLAVVQAALRLTRATDTPSFIRAIEGRLAALARAQTLLSADHWSGADLRALLHGELSPFIDGSDCGPRVAMTGPQVTLPAGATQPLSMAVHELATNAVKYGALSSPAGRLTIDWQVEHSTGPYLRLRWAEAGGPPLLAPPASKGFGSRVLSGTLRDQLSGTVTMDWNAAGLVCTMEVPLGRPASEALSGL